MTLISRFIHEDDGQNLIEYALLAGLITLGAVTAIGLSGDKIATIYQNLKTRLDEI